MASHRLQPAVQVAHSRKETAAKALADFQRRLTEQQTRLQQLLNFRSDYAGQLQAAGQSGITARRYQDYLSFLLKLDHSIAQSRQSVQRLQKEFQRKRQVWLMSRAKAQALEEVIQCDHREQERAEQCREQADSDERNLRSYRPPAED